jgi:hypothetical protein
VWAKKFARPYFNGEKAEHSCYGRKLNIGGLLSRLAWAKKQDPNSKITIEKRAGVMAQVGGNVN